MVARNRVSRGGGGSGSRGTGGPAAWPDAAAWAPADRWGLGGLDGVVGWRFLAGPGTVGARRQAGRQAAHVVRGRAGPTASGVWWRRVANRRCTRVAGWTRARACVCDGFVERKNKMKRFQMVAGR